MDNSIGWRPEFFFFFLMFWFLSSELFRRSVTATFVKKGFMSGAKSKLPQRGSTCFSLFTSTFAFMNTRLIIWWREAWINRRYCVRGGQQTCLGLPLMKKRDSGSEKTFPFFRTSCKGFDTSAPAERDPEVMGFNLTPNMRLQPL